MTRIKKLTKLKPYYLKISTKLTISPLTLVKHRKHKSTITEIKGLSAKILQSLKW